MRTSITSSRTMMPIFFNMNCSSPAVTRPSWFRSNRSKAVRRSEERQLIIINKNANHFVILIFNGMDFIVKISKLAKTKSMNELPFLFAIVMRSAHHKSVMNKQKITKHRKKWFFELDKYNRIEFVVKKRRIVVLTMSFKIYFPMKSFAPIGVLGNSKLGFVRMFLKKHLFTGSQSFKIV